MFFKSQLENYLRKTKADDETLFMYLANETINVKFVTDKKGNLHLQLNVHDATIQMTHELELSTADKIEMLTAINKDNNRIKSQIEEMQHTLKQ